jgi:hypothetical protein
MECIEGGRTFLEIVDDVKSGNYASAKLLELHFIAHLATNAVRDR